MKAFGGEKVTLKAQAPYGNGIDSFYGILPNGKTVIEMAAAACLPLVGDNRHAEKPPLKLRAKDDLRLTVDNIMHFINHMR